MLIVFIDFGAAYKDRATGLYIFKAERIAGSPLQHLLPLSMQN